MQVHFYSRCARCPQQCSNMCMEQGQGYTRIQCRLETDPQERSTFYARQISVEKQVEDRAITFYADIPRAARNYLYQINTPKLRLS